MIRVFIAAPTPMQRAGLRAMLDNAEIQVVGDAGSLEEARVALAGVDVLLLAGTDLGAEQATAWRDADLPAVVALADDDQAAPTLTNLPLRGWGLVPTDAASAELQAAVMAAAQGLVVLVPALAHRLLAARPPVQALVDTTLEEPLTPREREVLGLVGQGLSNKLIARALTISEHTVKFHVSAIYSKLGAANRTEAVNLGARRGLITL